MKTVLKSKLVNALIFSVLFTVSIIAQPSQGGLSAPVLPKLPFEIGETLTYEGKLSKIISGISVAELTMTFEKPETGDNYLIKAEARSKGTLLKLFRFSFLQKIDAVVDPQIQRSISTVKHDVQKERIRNSEALFDYKENRVTYTETDPNEPSRPPRIIASEIQGATHDLISGIYNLRTQQLAIGKSFELTVSDSGLVFNIPVKVTGRERLKTAIGRIWCFRVEPDVFGPGRLIEREGSMIIWITEDAKKIPVRATVNTSIGKVDIKLKSVAKAK